MILVDTSIWIDHLRSGDRALERALGDGLVLTHPWVIAELALGNLDVNAEAMRLLENLPRAAVATEKEVLGLIATQRLSGAGIGYVDCQLLAATRLTRDATLWTRDKRLSAVADRMGIGTLAAY